MWSINLNWLSLSEMIERKSYYIYIIYILYIYNKILFYHFPPSVLFYWPRDHTDHTDHAPNKKPVFSVVPSWWTRALEGWSFLPCTCLCYTKMFPFWRQHSRKDSGRWAFGAVAGFVPICRWRRTGKRQNVYKVYTKTTEISVKCGFYAFVYRNVGHRKLLIPKYCSSFAVLKTEMSYKQIF